MDNFNLLLAMMMNRMNQNLIKVNFYFTANKQTYTIKVNIKERIWQYLYRFNENQKELTGMNIFSVSFNNSKLDIDTQISETEIKDGDTVIVELELPSKESLIDWVNDKKHCKGKTTYPNGDVYVYEGDFQNGLPNGKGKIIWISGNVYEVEMKDQSPSYISRSANSSVPFPFF